jgi:acyl-CoA synthetase (AMP-forming)/AMP-acid ligase II
MSSSLLTAQRLVERSLRMYGDRVAVVDGERSISYRMLEERTARLANALLGLSAGPFRPVATLLPNAAEFLEVDVACTRAGMTRVGIPDRLSPDECRYILADSQAAVLVASPALLERIDGDLPETLESVVLVGGDRPAAGSWLDYELMLGQASPALAVPGVAPETPNYILYTSGTTGRPKGATHSHGGRALSTLNMLAAELRLTPESAIIHAGPVTHGSGSKIISFIAAGGRSIILPRFDPETFAAAILERGGTHTFLVPTMIQRLLEAGPGVVAAVTKLEQISFGGAPISASLFRRAIEEFGPILTQVYGSCEAPHPVTLLRPSDYLAEDNSDRVLTSAGRAAFGVDLKLVGDDGSELPAGELGELLVRAPHVMLGYWRNDEATQAAFTEGGWYSLGDLATLDADGLVTFRDRKRDMIISGGLNVYPSEVERVIAEHPGVREVAVVGAPDEEWGEAVVAYVVPADGTLTGEDIIAWTRERLAGYKKPKRVEFLERMPLGSSNKVLKKELRDLLWGDRDRRVN